MFAALAVHNHTAGDHLQLSSADHPSHERSFPSQLHSDQRPGSSGGNTGSMAYVVRLHLFDISNVLLLQQLSLQASPGCAYADLPIIPRN
jgi:hypothetical protein